MNRATRASRAARRLYRDCLVGTRLDDDRARQVVVRIVEARRRDGLAVLSHFRRFVRLDRDRHTATIESATPLPPDLQASLEVGLSQRYGPLVESSYVHNPSLIGGVRIRVAGDVYDGSIRGRLAALEARL